MKSSDHIFKDFYFWLSLLLGGFVLAQILWFGIGMDQAIYAYGAWVWKYHHLPPYIGAWDGNYPGVFIIHRMAIELFGPSVFGFRVFDFLAQFSGMAMIFYLAKKTTGSGSAAFLVCLFYGFYYFGRGRWDAGQRDAFVFWCLLAAVFFVVTLKDRAWICAASAGLLAGFAFLIRPTYGLAWPALGIFMLAQGNGKRTAKTWLALLLFFFACLVPSLIVIIYYGRGGYLGELYRALIEYNFEVYSRLKPAPIIDSWPARPFFFLNSIFSSQPVVALLGLFSALLFAKGEEDGKERGVVKLVLAMTCIGLFSYVLLGKNLQYQLIPFWGFMIILAGTGVNRFGEFLKQSYPGAAGRALTGIFYLALAVFMFASIPDRWVAYAAGHSFRDLDSGYLSGVDVSDRLLSENHYRVAGYLKDKLGPGDGIEVFGAHPLIPFLLQKKLPSRFVCVQHLFFSPERKPLNPLQIKWIGEYTSAVISARPRFFVVADQGVFLPVAVSQPSFKRALSEKFPELEAFLHDNYGLVKKIDQTEIYELLPGQVQGARGGQGQP